MGRYANLKLGTMRKPQEFAVMSTKEGGFLGQSDRSTFRVDAEGEGVLNIKGTYFIHLNECMGAKKFKLTAEELELVKGACIRPGMSIGPGVIMGEPA